MDSDNNLVIPIVGIAIAIIMIGAILVPTISESASVASSVSNEGNAEYRMCDFYDYTGNGTSIELLRSGNDGWTINGEKLSEDLHIRTDRCYIDIVSDHISGAYNLNAVTDAPVSQGIHWVGDEMTFNRILIEGSIMFYEGTKVFLVQVPYEWGFISKADGDWAMVSGSGAYVRTSSDIHAVGRTTISEESTIWCLRNTTLSWYPAVTENQSTVAGGTLTVISPTTNLDQGKHYGELTLPITFDDTSAGLALTSIDSVIVPYKITWYDEPWQESSTAMLWAIPLIMIVVVLLWAVELSRTREE